MQSEVSKIKEIMSEKHISIISKEIPATPAQVKAVSSLLDEGATLPFIARYRKEATGSLDEVAVTAIRDRLGQLMELDKRREAIVKSLEERGLLTDELKEKIGEAESLTVLEDIYLPFRPKRLTRARVAKEKGLEPLAVRIFEQGEMDIEAEAALFIDAEKGVASVEEAINRRGFRITVRLSLTVASLAPGTGQGFRAKIRGTCRK